MSDLRQVEMENMLVDLYGQQVKCERIKNFPYPRQYATLNLMFVRLFNGMVPFGMLGEFAKLGEHFVWLTIPFTAVVAWVFIMMANRRSHRESLRGQRERRAHHGDDTHDRDRSAADAGRAGRADAVAGAEPHPDVADEKGALRPLLLR